MPRVDLLHVVRARRGRGPIVALAAVLLAFAAAGASMLGPAFVETQSAAGAPVAKPSAGARRRETTVKTVPIERWLATLADEAGVGLVLAPGVAGTSVTATFSPDVDWQRRLDAVARLHALDVQLEDGLLEITSREPEPPAGALAPVTVGESALAPSLVVGSAAIEAAPKPRHITRLLRLSNARASDLVRALDGPLRAGGITAGFDPATNALVLGGPEGEIDSAVDLAQQLDIPRRRFLLEAHIVELSRSARQEMGVQWTLESGDLGGIVDFPAAATEGEGGGIVVATSGTHTLRARLSALESEGRVRVISRPRIVVVEGKPASIEAVRILRVRLPDRGAVVAESDSTVALGAGRAFEEIRVGVRLEVEPALHGEGNVVLRIIAKSSTLGPPQPPDGIPEELSRRVEAEVVVADGHTAVLGGLLREGSARSGAGIPVLRSLPLLGALFGRRSRERDVEKLIVLVTPRLIS